MLSRDELPHDVQKHITNILNQGVDSATEDQLAFLRARRDYLSREEQVNFGLTQAGASQSDSASEKPARKSRKAADQEAG